MHAHSKKKRIIRAENPLRKPIRRDIETAMALNIIMSEVIAQNERMPIQKIKRDVRNKSRGYTVATLCSGGCLDTIASVMAGYTPVWGTEVNEKLRALWRALTNSPDLGDTFDPHRDWGDEETPDLLWSGQPCPDHSVMGKQRGVDGETGWMYVTQWQVILKVKPKTFILEQVDNVDAAAVEALTEQLTDEYEIHQKVISVRDFNDLSNRKRLFIVGLHKSLGEPSRTFKFPTPAMNPGITARHIADRDEDVPDHQWIKLPTHIRQRDTPDTPTGDRLVKIAKLGPGPGHSRRPNDLYSWDGNLNTGTRFNGGGIRPPLN